MKSSTWHNTVTKESWHAKAKDQSQPFRFRYHELQTSCFLQPHIQTAGHRGNINSQKSPQRSLSELSLDPPTGHVVTRRSDARLSLTSTFRLTVPFPCDADSFHTHEVRTGGAGLLQKRISLAGPRPLWKTTRRCKSRRHTGGKESEPNLLLLAKGMSNVDLIVMEERKKKGSESPPSEP